MAPSKPKSKAISKAATKSAAKKAPAKPATKPVAKKVAARPAAKKAVSKPAARPAAKPVTVTSARPAQLHAVPSAKRSNAPTPKWIDDALAYTQQNPAVSLVSIIAIAVGILLLIS